MKVKDDRNFKKYLVEKNPQKDIKFLFDNFEGELKPFLYEMIKKCARELNTEIIIDHI